MNGCAAEWHAAFNGREDQSGDADLRRDEMAEPRRAGVGASVKVSTFMEGARRGGQVLIERIGPADIKIF